MPLLSLIYYVLTCLFQVLLFCVVMSAWYIVYQVMQHVDVHHIYEALIYYIDVGSAAYNGN